MNVLLRELSPYHLTREENKMDVQGVLKFKSIVFVAFFRYRCGKKEKKGRTAVIYLYARECL